MKKDIADPLDQISRDIQNDSLSEQDSSDFEVNRLDVDVTNKNKRYQSDEE